jgi:hypothetical protein
MRILTGDVTWPPPRREAVAAIVLDAIPVVWFALYMVVAAFD